jgi:D-mannonate dehydratase
MNKNIQDFMEEIQVLGKDLVEKVKALIHEGNVQRIIIKDEHGHTFIEIPVTFAAVGAILAPVLAAVAAIATLVAKFTVVVERRGEPPQTNTKR